MEKEELIKIFMGPEYERLKKKNFSIWALIFNSGYFAYRKMYGMAIVCQLIFLLFSTFLTLIVSRMQNSGSAVLLTIASMICMFLAIALSFGSMYRNYASKQVDKIINTNTTKPKEEIAKKIGGTSLGSAIVFLIIVGFVSSIISGQVSKINKASTPVNNNYSAVEEDEEDEEEELPEDPYKVEEEVKVNKATKFKGMFTYDRKAVKKHFNINIPMDFKEDVNAGWAYTYNYQKQNTKGELDFINVNYGIISQSNDARDLFNEMEIFYDDAETESYSERGVVWYRVERPIKDDQVTITYITENDSKVMVIQFDNHIEKIEEPEEGKNDQKAKYDVYTEKIEKRDALIKNIIESVSYVTE